MKLSYLLSCMRRKGRLQVAFAMFFFTSFHSFSFGQNVTVSGAVTDSEDSTPLIGVTIAVKGTSLGTVTRTDGTYSISVPADATLDFNYTGYLKQAIPVNGQTRIDVALTPGAETLEEFVVVGFGIQKKVDVTGAVASLNIEALSELPNTNIAQFLQGTLPGLNVGVATTAGGTPPISVRGRVSLNGNQNVLVILDGIQYTGSLSAINPDDIASIDVLKDASSTAVYGAQAANGVILITSRKGRPGEKPRISFNTGYTTQTPTVGEFKPKNREGYLAGITEAFYDRAYTQESGYTAPNPTFNVKDVVDGSMRDANGELLPNDFNWWEAGTNKGTISETNLSVSGGSDKVSYLFSGGLVDQKGFIINDKFARKSIRANIELQPLNWWKVGLVSLGSFVNQDGAEPALATIQRASPLHVPYDANGNLIVSPTNTIELNAFTTYEVDDYERHNYYFANIYNEISFPFLKGLTYRLNFGNNFRTDKRYFSSIFDAGQTGRAFKDDQTYYDYTLDNIVNYNNTFGKHEVGATLLYGSIKREFNSTFAEARGFSRLTLSYNDLALGTNQFANSDGWNEALLYQMARLNYKFDNKYLVTATVRRDGFSGFAKNNKSAVFPTVALGWILSEEGFMQNMKAIELLKLRVGYGVIGNQTSRYSSIASLSTSAAYVFGDGGTTAFGQQVNRLGNDNLKWERTKGLNIGLDFSLFDGKTQGTLDAYNNNTYDLLFSVAIPSITGFDNITTNLGQINNRGFEASITQHILSKSDFSWTAGLVFSSNKNKIVTLTGQDANNDGTEDDLISSGLFIGKSISTIYDYVANGVYDLDDPRLPGFPIGSMSVVDQNGDGDITPAGDRVFLGRQEPAYRISLSNTLNFKGFRLSFLLNSVQGGKESYRGVNRPFANNIPQYYREDNTVRWNDFVGIDYWSPNNPEGRYPRNISGSRAKVEPAMYENRSFVRLQDVTLSYNLAAGLLKKVGAQNINLFVSGKNLVTWTNWEGWDPESGEGIVAGGRPVLRAFTVGASIIY